MRKHNLSGTKCDFNKAKKKYLPVLNYTVSHNKLALPSFSHTQMATALLNIQGDKVIEKTVATLVILPSYLIAFEDGFVNIFL